MEFKKFMMNVLSTYFTLVTLITIATLVLGLSLQSDATFGYEAFASPLIYAACGVVPMIVMYTKKELTRKEFLVRKVIQLVVIEILVLYAACRDYEPTGQMMQRIIVMIVCIFVIYILAHVIGWVQDYMSAKKMTEQLMVLQGKCK